MEAGLELFDLCVLLAIVYFEVPLLCEKKLTLLLFNSVDCDW